MGVVRDGWKEKRNLSAWDEWRCGTVDVVRLRLSFRVTCMLKVEDDIFSASKTFCPRRTRRLG